MWVCAPTCSCGAEIAELKTEISRLAARLATAEGVAKSNAEDIRSNTYAIKHKGFFRKAILERADGGALALEDVGDRGGGRAVLS